LYESKILKALQGTSGFPKFYDYKIENGRNFLVMEVLGPSLEELFSFCNRRFSIKTVLMIADQLLTRIELLHSKSLLHRDIKVSH